MRFNFMQRDGALHVMPSQIGDLSSIRLALQVGAAVGAPFVLALATGTLWGQAGVGLLIGGAFGTMLVMRTSAEAQQMDREHDLKLAHAAELSRIEVKEREALLPRRQRASVPRPAIQRPVPDGAEQDELLLASDVRAFLEAGIKQGGFGRNQFIKTGQPRMKLPSGTELTRPEYERLVRALLEQGLLVKGLDGAPTLPGGWKAARLDGSAQDTRIVADNGKRVGA